MSFSLDIDWGGITQPTIVATDTAPGCWCGEPGVVAVNAGAGWEGRCQDHAVAVDVQPSDRPDGLDQEQVDAAKAVLLATSTKRWKS